MHKSNKNMSVCPDYNKSKLLLQNAIGNVAAAATLSMTLIQVWGLQAR